MPDRGPSKRVLATAALVLLAVGAGFGFLAGRRSAPAPAVLVGARPMRTGETPVHDPAVRDGNLDLRPTGITCGLDWVVGTHTDLEARGQYCRLGLAVTNLDASFHDFTNGWQRLVGADGKTFAPSLDATRIERQADVTTIGARDTVDLDVWFDVPATERITGARLRGDDETTSTGTDTAVTAPHPAGGGYARLPA